MINKHQTEQHIAHWNLKVSNTMKLQYKMTHFAKTIYLVDTVCYLFLIEPIRYDVLFMQ